jgi:hypothetical protein
MRSTKKTFEMANVDKAYYQQAAHEVAQGQLDHALWTKVRADNPHSGDKAIQPYMCRRWHGFLN